MKTEAQLTLRDIIDYEARSSAWWCSFIFWGWGQDLAARYLSWKAKRKFARYVYWGRETMLERIRLGLANLEEKEQP